MSAHKYSLTKIPNADILANYTKSVEWKKEQKTVLAVTVKESYQKKIKDTSSAATPAEAKSTG